MTIRAVRTTAFGGSFRSLFVLDSGERVCAAAGNGGDEGEQRDNQE